LLDEDLLDADFFDEEELDDDDRRFFFLGDDDEDDEDCERHVVFLTVFFAFDF
jgi:hypothetical protein